MYVVLHRHPGNADHRSADSQLSKHLFLNVTIKAEPRLWLTQQEDLEIQVGNFVKTKILSVAKINIIVSYIANIP